MSMSEQSAYDIETIEQAIRSARAIIDTVRDRLVRTKSDGSLVTDSDVAIQQAILSTLSHRHGGELIIGEEETAGSQPASSLNNFNGRWWGIDPIDGTTNFVSGVPIYCVSVGLCEGQRPKAGAIWDPNRAHLHSSWDIRPDPWPAVTSISELRIGVEFEGPGNVPAQAASVVHELIPEAAMVRVFGCAALGLAWVSMGWLDAFFHPRLAPWDYAAGSALVTAAGGTISSPYIGSHSSWVLAASPSAYPIISDYIQKKMERY